MLIGGFQPFSLSDFPDRPAAIVFTQGCNFRCPYCHNGHLLSCSASPAESVPGIEDILRFLAVRAGLLTGVVITGGEPTLQPDLSDFLRDIKSLGLAVKLDTNGSRPGVVHHLVTAGLVDYLAMDIKAPFDKYAELCGAVIDVSDIRQSIRIIAASAVSHHFRTTFYKTLLNDGDITRLLALVPHGSAHVLQACRMPARDERQCVGYAHDNTLVDGVEPSGTVNQRQKEAQKVREIPSP